MKEATLMKRFLIVGLFAALILGGLALAACEEEDDGDGDPTATTAAETPDGQATPGDGAQAQEITVVSSDTFAYDPDALTLTAGEPVIITLDNSGAAIEHDLRSDDLPASDIVAAGESSDEVFVTAAGGETATLEFTPSEAGEYVFYCAVEGHRDAGMEGTITVE
jgi:plastocyanin